MFVCFSHSIFMTTYLEYFFVFYVNVMFCFVFYFMVCAEVDLLKLSNEPLK